MRGVPELRFSATLGEEPEVEVPLVQVPPARALHTGPCASRGVLRSPPERQRMEDHRSGEQHRPRHLRAGRAKLGKRAIMRENVEHR